MEAKKTSKGQKFLKSLATICRYSAIILAVLLPLLVPFESSKNIDFQAYVLIITGILSLISLSINRFNGITGLSSANRVLIGIIAISYILSCAVTPNLDYNLLGAPYFRFGLLGLFSVFLLALLIIQSSRAKLSFYLYYYLLVLNVAAIPYTYFRLHSLYRLGGLFSQADLMGVMIGLNIIFGLDLIKSAKSRRSRLGLQLISLGLFMELVLTQTRAVVYLTILICALWYFIQFGVKIRRDSVVLIVAALVIFIASSYIGVNSQRITNASYAEKSITYRLNLQKDAANQILKKPLFGWGPGNLADAVDCKYLSQADLKNTCAQHFFFNSSHNIYLDSILMIGFIGGISYLVFTLANLYKSLRAGVKDNIFWFSSLLITSYYLTNVTNIELEAFFWLSMLAMILRSWQIKNRAEKD